MENPVLSELGLALYLPHLLEEINKDHLDEKSTSCVAGMGHCPPRLAGSSRQRRGQASGKTGSSAVPRLRARRGASHVIGWGMFVSSWCVLS